MQVEESNKQINVLQGDQLQRLQEDIRESFSEEKESEILALETN